MATFRIDLTVEVEADDDEQASEIASVLKTHLLTNQGIYRVDDAWVEHVEEA